MQGKIVKGIAGFYYVHVVESGVYECKAKGIFRKDGVKPLVGDNVEIEILDEKDMEGNIMLILPRKNELIRPAVANIDQALVVFAVTKPKPHLNLLDRFLVMMESREVPVILCFNKTDIADDPDIAELKEIYEKCGYPLLFTSAAFGVILSIAHTFSPEGEKEESERLKMKSEKQGRKNRREEYEPEEVLVDEVEDGELPEMQPRTVTPPTGRRRGRKPAEYDEDRDFDILGEEGIGEIRDELESEGREVLNELKRRGR